MKIPINLASQPFRRDRALLVGSVGVCAVLVATPDGAGFVWPWRTVPSMATCAANRAV